MSAVSLGMPKVRAEDIEEYRTRDVTCQSCAALCCRQGVRLDLTPKEAGFMQAGGTELTELGPPREPRKKSRMPFSGYVELNLYQLDTDCAYAEQGPDGQTLCTVYDNPDRPEACARFPEGEYRCREMRYQNGIDTAAQWATYRLVTDPTYA